MAKVRKGKAPKVAREKDHPLTKAMHTPEIVIAKVITIVPIFSPKAFYMAKVSFPILAESSAGLLTSNQAGSCLRIEAT